MNATANDSPVALVVDDDSMMRLLLRQTLEGNGFIVYEAEAGRAALTSFTEIRPAIVLLDVMMPGLDGFEVCAALRAMPEGQRTPIIMLTGLDDIPSIQRAYDMGATDFILKPINWLILAHRVRYILRAHDAFERLAESQGRLRDAQRIAKLGSWRWDLRTDMIEYSEEARRILEITSGDGFHLSANMIDRVHPKDRESVRKARENAHTQLNPYGVEYRLGDQEEIGKAHV